MFGENRRDSFDARIRRLVYGFYQGLDVSENSPVVCVVDSSTWLLDQVYTTWNECLYVSKIAS